MPGPAPGSRCVVCNHPGIVLINNLINRGESDYKVAGQFKLHRDRIRNHRTKAHPGIKLAAANKAQTGNRVVEPEGEEWPYDAPPAEPDVEGDDPRARLERLIRTLTVQANEDGARPEVFRELRLSLEAVAKMGSLEPPPVVRVQDVAGLPEMLRDMHEALKPWPEARAAMAAVWRRHRATEDGEDDAPQDD